MSKRPGDPGYAPGWCVHFRSMGQFNTCEKGVPYDKFKPGIITNPCFCREPANEQYKEYCEHRRVPTELEIALHKKWASNRTDNLATALMAIAPWADAQRRKRQSGTKSFDCPVCKAVSGLYVVIVASNGHTRGKCQTKGCVEWIQ